MRIAIVEDNADVRAQLCGFVEQYAAESGKPLEVQTFPDGAAIAPYQGGFDIIFMDIEMPQQGGMATAERIRAVDQDVVLVFVTNMAQYAIRGYEVDALDFVLKPLNYYQFKVKLERAIHRVERRGSTQIPIQTMGRCGCSTPTISTIWKPIAACCIIIRLTRCCRCAPVCKAPKNSWHPTILCVATSVIWSTCAMWKRCRMILCW